MKKISYGFFILLLASFNASFGQQSAVAGNSPAVSGYKITYDVTFPDEGRKKSSYASDNAALPTSQVVWIRNGMMRVETKSVNGTTVVISDCKNKTAATLSEVRGKKYAVKTTTADVQNEAGQISNMTIQKVDDSKMIAGYNCQKIVYSITDNNNQIHPSEIYVSDQVRITEPNWYSAAFREVKEFMFEFTVMQNGTSVKFTVKSIAPFTDSDGIFTVPAEYKQVSKEELVKLSAK